MTAEIPAGSFIVATRIEVRDESKLPEFMQYVRQSLTQARHSVGFLHADVRAESPYYYTRSAWRSREDMLRFRDIGDHAQAVGRARFLSEEVVSLSWIGNTMPSWEDVKNRFTFHENFLNIHHQTAT